MPASNTLSPTRGQATDAIPVTRMVAVGRGTHRFPFPIVGITGSIASGKSTVCALWEKQGAVLVDADQLTRTLTAPGMPALAQIAQRFGNAVINPDGSLNRAALGSIVFSKPEERSWLESLLHPLVRQSFRDAIAHAASRADAESIPFFIYAAPLMIEAGIPQELDALVVVVAPDQQLIARAVQRGGVSAAQAQQRLASQMPTADKLKVATHVLQNDDSLAVLEHRAEVLFVELRDTLRAVRAQRKQGVP